MMMEGTKAKVGNERTERVTSSSGVSEVDENGPCVLAARGIGEWGYMV